MKTRVILGLVIVLLVALIAIPASAGNGDWKSTLITGITQLDEKINQLENRIGALEQLEALEGKVVELEERIKVLEGEDNNMGLSGYKCRKPFYLVKDGECLENYQVQIVPHKSSNADSGRDVYLGTKVQDDFDDFRVTKGDGETLLDQWRESLGAPIDDWILESRVGANRGSAIGVTGKSVIYDPGNNCLYVFYFDYSDCDQNTHLCVNKLDLSNNTWGTRHQFSNVDYIVGENWNNNQYYENHISVCATLDNDNYVWLVWGGHANATYPIQMLRSNYPITSGSFVWDHVDTWSAASTIETTVDTTYQRIYVSSDNTYCIFMRYGNASMKVYWSTNQGTDWSSRVITDEYYGPGDWVDDKLFIAPQAAKGAGSDWYDVDATYFFWTTVDDIINNNGAYSSQQTEADSPAYSFPVGESDVIAQDKYTDAYYSSYRLITYSSGSIYLLLRNNSLDLILYSKTLGTLDSWTVTTLKSSADWSHRIWDCDVSIDSSNNVIVTYSEGEILKYAVSSTPTNAGSWGWVSISSTTEEDWYYSVIIPYSDQIAFLLQASYHDISVANGDARDQSGATWDYAALVHTPILLQATYWVEIAKVGSSLATEDYSIAETEIDVADGSVFAANDYVIICDDNTPAGEVRQITGIAGNTLTVAGLTNAYTSAANAKVCHMAYLFYKNDGASLLSDGDDTFILFDDFDDDSLDPNKWLDVSDGAASISESGGIITAIHGDITDKGYLRSKNQLGKNIRVIVNARRKLVAAAALVLIHWDGAHTAAWDNPDNCFVGWVRYTTGATKILKYVGGTESTLESAASYAGNLSWHQYGLGYYNTELTFFEDGESIHTIDATDFASTYIGLAGREREADTEFDNALVCNYVYPEPTWGTWGSEECIAEAGSSSAAKLIGAGLL